MARPKVTKINFDKEKERNNELKPAARAQARHGATGRPWVSESRMKATPLKGTKGMELELWTRSFAYFTVLHGTVGALEKFYGRRIKGIALNKRNAWNIVEY